MIEQRRAEEVAVLVFGDLETAAVEHELRPFGNTFVDVARDLVAMRARDQRPHVRLLTIHFAVAGTDLEL